MHNYSLRLFRRVDRPVAAAFCEAAACKLYSNYTFIKGLSFLLVRWFINEKKVIGDYTTEMIIHNATRDLHDAIVKCEVHNDVGKSEDTETLDITCEYANEVKCTSRQKGK